MKKETYFWLLHILVFINSAVPIVVVTVALSSFEIVFLRTLFAFILLAGVVLFNKVSLRISVKQFLSFMISGLLTAALWISMIYCVKISNASVTLVGLATAPLWVSFLNPLASVEKLSFYRVLIGMSALFGIYMIYNSGFDHHSGLLMSIGCGFLSAVLNILNSNLTKRYNHFSIAFYQMGGACAGTVLFAMISGNADLLLQVPGWYDIAVIFTLAVLFSVISYLVMLKILRHISAFTVSLVFNLTPIYGSVLASIALSQSERMNIYFYGGTIILVFSVFAHPLSKILISEPEETAIREAGFDFE